MTSENVPSIDNLRAHSPQIADHSRPQPDTPAGNSGPQRRTTSPHRTGTLALASWTMPAPVRWLEPGRRKTVRPLARRDDRQACFIGGLTSASPTYVAHPSTYACCTSRWSGALHRWHSQGSYGRRAPGPRPSQTEHTATDVLPLRCDGPYEVDRWGTKSSLTEMSRRTP